jgi:general secretion pathway protein E
MMLRIGVERQNVVNISTIEDPVEYTIPRVNQVHVNVAAGLDFAAGLRTLLRQDPDIIMVGEIRDLETAEIAVRSALVGRLLISTLHTNDSTGAVPRLLDMGVEPFLLSSSLIGVLAQRLVRVLDPAQCEAYAASEYECRLLNVDPSRPPMLYRAGADEKGYTGRTGIYELVAVDNTMRTMIHDGAGEHELERYARQNGPSIREDGMRKVLAGTTTLEEVLRVTRSD